MITIAETSFTSKFMELLYGNIISITVKRFEMDKLKLQQWKPLTVITVNVIQINVPVI